MSYEPTRDGVKDSLVLVRALIQCDHAATQAVMANTEPLELTCSLVSLLAGELTTHYDGRTLAVIAGRIAAVDAAFDSRQP